MLQITCIWTSAIVNTHILIKKKIPLAKQGFGNITPSYLKTYQLSSGPSNWLEPASTKKKNRKQSKFINHTKTTKPTYMHLLTVQKLKYTPKYQTKPEKRKWSEINFNTTASTTSIRGQSILINWELIPQICLVQSQWRALWPARWSFRFWVPIILKRRNAALCVFSECQHNQCRQRLGQR